ncbi:MAG TPA: hypothetical protein VM240_06045 [Verrucomicrobiae bacterium]|nr:hypothetical protein [Verrucomicrobiae bacterium]
MPPKEISLFLSACGKLRIARVGPLTQLVIDGQGLAYCLTADFSVVEKWAKSKGQGPNATIDAAKMIEKVDVMVCRPGTTFASTRGSTKPLEAVCKAMRQAGIDIKEFALPPELKDMNKPVDQVLAAKEAGEAKAAKAAAAAAALQEPPISDDNKGQP